MWKEGQRVVTHLNLDDDTTEAYGNSSRCNIKA